MNTRSENTFFEDELLSSFSGRRMFIVPGSTCGRYGIDTLAAMAMMHGPDHVYEGAVFAFCHKSGMQVRFLLWEDGGYWLITRKIYSNSFAWPDSGEDGRAIVAATGLIRKILHSAGCSRKSVLEECERAFRNIG